MLIESNENKNYGVIIYSENRFDFVNNFTKVNKSDPNTHENIDFKEVSEFISQPIEKNLILYRLITNDENLDPFSSKLGYFIKVSDRIEVVYFDPVFIIKDIDNLSITIPRDEFKFKIQQVGYKTSSVDGYSSIYEERFSIEMSDVEAKNQNDSLFAKTMLSVKKISEKSKNERDKISKHNLFKNVVAENEENQIQFYHLDKNQHSRNTTFTERLEEEKPKSEENDFFSRVKLKKDRKEYKSNTLKMFK